MTNYRSIYRAGRFENYTLKPLPKLSFMDYVRLLFLVVKKPATARPQPRHPGETEMDVIPVQPLRAEDLNAAPSMSLWKLSHSIVLLKLGKGRYFLTDPVFSSRASPVQWAGPRRYSRLPFPLEELAKLQPGGNSRKAHKRPISGVLISHDHYDHLDEASVNFLANITDTFFVPLKLGATLVAMGVDPRRIREFDWWDTMVLHHGEVQITCTPAHHYSKRSMFSSRATLWCSWCINQRLDAGSPTSNSSGSEELGRGTISASFGRSDSYFRIYFSGDSGWHRGFAKIGQVCGPFDVTLLENGQYNHKYWHAWHMLPRETAQAHIDLRGRWLIPIHNSTFSLGVHPWYEPLVQIHAFALQLRINLCTPIFGERVDLLNITTKQRWWKPLIN